VKYCAWTCLFMLTLVVGCQKPSDSVDTNQSQQADADSKVIHPVDTNQSQQADADSKVIHPSDAEFNNLIAGGKPVLVDFFATW
jgi:thiol:disulfide interchange protein